MIRASQVLFWFGLSLAAVTALYHTSDRTRELDRQMRAINAAIDNEEQNLHVLKAEWVYLSNPTRVETEAKKHLALLPTAPDQVIQLASLDDTLPTNEEARQNVAVAATPIETVKTSLAVLPQPSPKHVAARKVAVVAANDGRINDRMVIQRTASVQSTDTIGALIDGLGSRP